MILRPVGGGVTRGITSTFKAYCSVSESVGDVVRISGNKIGNYYQVSKVDIDNSDLVISIAVGVISEKLSDTVCTVTRLGILSGVYTGLAYGRLVFVGTDSRLTIIRPSDPLIGYRMVQVVGHTLSSSDIFVQINNPIRTIPIGT